MGWWLRQLIWLFVWIPLWNSAWGADADRTNILILYSYHRADWSDNINSGINFVMSDVKDAEFYVEYMDTKKLNTPDYLELLHQIYERKYKKRRLSLVITADDNAFHFALEHGDDLFHGAPVVFCGVNSFDPAILETHKNVTGVEENTDFKDSLAWALKALPNTRKIYLICDDTRTCEINKALFAEAVDKNFPHIKYEFLQNVSLDELRTKLASLPGDSFAFFISFWKDANGQNIFPSMLDEVLAQSTVPVFGRVEWMIGKGVVGGKCVRGFNQGAAAAELGKKILSGTKPSDIPVIHDSPNQFMFDHKLLKKYRLLSTPLPPDSVILNSPEEYYRLDKNLASMFIFSLVVITLGLLITIAFFIHHHRLSRQLKSSVQQYRSIFNFASDAIFVHDAATGELLDVNEKTLSMYNCTKDEIINGSIEEFCENRPPYTAKEAAAYLKDAVAGQRQMFEWHARKKSGELFWVDVSMNVADIDGKRCVIVAARDIDERKKSELELHAVETRFRNLVHSSPLGIYLFELRGRDSLILVDANPAAGKMTGVDRQSLIDKRIEEAFPALTEQVLDSCLKAARDGVYWNTTNYFYQDSQITGSYDVHVFQTSPGRMAVMFMDVTEKSKMENALKESEERYRLLIDAAPDGVLIFKDRTIINCNPKAVELFGFSGKELVGKGIFEVSPELQYNGQPSVEAIEVFSENLRSDNVVNFQWRHLRKDGSVFDADVSLRTIYTHGEMDVIAFIRDITERKRADEQLQHSQKMESIGTLAGGVAHDFNNMLAGILGGAQLIQRKLPGETSVEKYVKMIVESAKRAGDLTQKLLAFSRKGQQQTVAININDLVRNVVGLLEHTVDRRINIHLDLHDNENLITEGDPSQLESAILNIAINAKDALPDGGMIFIQTTRKTLDQAFVDRHPFNVKPGEYIEVSIEDNGVGIASDILPYIFEPFFTTKEVGRGTGIGLSAVYGTLKSHHGTIGVRSSVGEGSVFTVYVPFAPAASPALGSGGSGSDRALPATVLVIDDEEVIRDACSVTLDDEGIKVLTAEDGQEGIRVFKENAGDIDLVLLDLVMPKMNGEQVFHEIRRIAPEIKVILSSGFNLDGSGANALLKEGAVAFIQKPYDYNHLVNLVKNTIRSSSG